MSRRTDCTRRVALGRTIAAGLGLGGLVVGSAQAGRPGGGPPAARATMPNQTSDGGTVRVAMVDMVDGGFISIHDVRRFGETRLGNDRPADVILDSIVGIEGPLEPGQQNNVEVELFAGQETGEPDGVLHDADGLLKSQPLLVIPHRNPSDGEFEPFDPAYTDGPKTVSTLPIVNDIGTIRLAGDSRANKQEAQAVTRDIRNETITPP